MFKFIKSSIENFFNISNYEYEKDSYVLLCKKLNDKAIIPTKGSKFSAGFDLYAFIEKETDFNGDEENERTVIIQPNSRSLINTGISLSFPNNKCYGRVAPRSGLAIKNCIDIGAGVIDSDYTGEIKVVLENNGKIPFKINHGDRIAQLIIEKIIQAEIIQVETLELTERGENGFGSTGTN
jgi:dUTP pyrophosphatase